MCAPRVISFAGKTGDLKFWSEETSLTVACLKQRLHTLGWPLEKVLTEPVRSKVELPKKGQKFGRMTVKRACRHKGHIYLRCDCDCGTRDHIITLSNLKRGFACGCQRRERMIEFNKQRRKTA